MAKKITLLFCVILALIFNFTPAANAEENSIGIAKEATANLENIEKSSIVEDIGLIAKTIKSVSETYQSVKAQIVNVFNYCRMIVQATGEILGKIENGGTRIRNYIRDKIDILVKEREINLFLT